MNREQVREAVKTADAKWWGSATISARIPLADYIVETIMALDKPPTVTREAIRAFGNLVSGELVPFVDYGPGPCTEAGKRIEGQLADFLTAAGVNVEE